ncbi:pyridoxal phosphate-dependent aminotransferase [Rhodovulum sp. 12E13]|uniref:pyridoxal phosphate-dependent aminotransferase n=1 Tax=Rhodovulum sp. 12E13 TaxID=2203891 RepID=UPI000E17C5A3|nr:pyridoxal phosphate-dependent aminotransferase [Rhodovulum sp. 12E13]RDC74971.1 pyridoxal phosphate-dependent aminotransferase [Rhodovulum sp. 12E13]
MSEPQNDPRLTPLAASLPFAVPFVGPETQVRARGRPFAARLGANECGFGPSPRVIEALRAAAPEAWMYGDAESWELRQALAAHHGVPMESVIVGEGIDGLLGYLVRLLVAPGETVVTSAGAYPTFAYHVAGYGGALHAVPYRGDFEDTEALVAAAAQTGAKLVYLANPDNPMGSWHEAGQIAAALDALPARALMVLDEAYADFAPAAAIPPVDPADRRVIRMRTFSKAHGLAGMRVGYAIGHPDLIAAFHKVRNHFGMCRLSQTAALASLSDPEHLAATVAKIDAAKAELGRIAAAHGLSALPSATNFVAIDCGADGGFAHALLRELVSRDVFVRMPGVAPLDRCIRVSAGPEADLAAFARALPEALDAAREGADAGA